MLSAKSALILNFHWRSDSVGITTKIPVNLCADRGFRRRVDCVIQRISNQCYLGLVVLDAVHDTVFRRQHHVNLGLNWRDFALVKQALALLFRQLLDPQTPIV